MPLPNEEELESAARNADPNSILEKFAVNAGQIWLTSKTASKEFSEINFINDSNHSTYSTAAPNQPGSEADFDDCVAFVTAIVTASATALGGATAGPIGSIAAAALGSGGGIAVSRLVCRRIIKEN